MPKVDCRLMDWRRAFEASLSLLCSDSLQPPAQPAVIAETGEVSALTAGPAGGCVPGGTQPPPGAAVSAETSPVSALTAGWAGGCVPGGTQPPQDRNLSDARTRQDRNLSGA